MEKWQLAQPAARKTMIWNANSTFVLVVYYEGRQLPTAQAQALNPAIAAAQVEAVVEHSPPAKETVQVTNDFSYPASGALKNSAVVA